MNDTKMQKKMLRMAKKILIATRCTSISHLQRKMRISYNSANMMMSEISKLSGFRFLYKARKKSFSRLGSPVRFLKKGECKINWDCIQL